MSATTRPSPTFRPVATVAVVTGASRGLGRAMALRLAADGHVVVVHYQRQHEAATAVADEIERCGGRALVVQGSLASVLGIEEFYTQLDQVLVATTGSNQFDHLVCNAGAIHAATVEHTSEAAFDALFDVNVKGVFFAIQKALPRLRSGGSIVTLGSGLTRFAYPQYVAYAASKGAVDALTRVLAKDLGAQGITVNTVAPGPVDTDLNADWLRHPAAREHIAAQTALGRVAEPSDVEGVVSFLCSPASRWVTGQRIEVSGGIHL